MMTMKDKNLLFECLVMGLVLVSGLWILIYPIYSQTQEVSPVRTKTISLKEACVKAAIRGIELDMERLQKWLEIPKGKLTEGAAPRKRIKSRLNQLKVELEKYKSIRLQDYELPDKREVIGWINQPCTENTILQIEGMSRSGPFYHIVGIKGGNYSVIKPQIKYRMAIYLVYPRYYPFPSYYIYLAAFCPLTST